MTDPASTVHDLSPEQFEVFVRDMLVTDGSSLSDFQAVHRQSLDGTDGSYVIDVVARFTALQADFVVLVECKHYRNPVKREAVELLHSRLRSVGAHKGMLFSTSGFQRGAIEFALAHGVALIKVADGGTAWLTRSMNGPTRPPEWMPSLVGWEVGLGSDGQETWTLLPQCLPPHMRPYVK